LRYRHTGAARSRAAHPAPRVSIAVTVALAGLAALITLWLGSLAQLSGARQSASAVAPDQLAVVQVQAGETLQHLAGRVAPEAPVEQTVTRIRQLNDLDSAAVEAGQTLIAPVG
jgi:predicted Zn-dependent protease